MQFSKGTVVSEDVGVVMWNKSRMSKTKVENNFEGKVLALIVDHTLKRSQQCLLCESKHHTGISD